MRNKKIKIRFIETEGLTNFSAQRKTWFGWTDIGYKLVSDCGPTLLLLYYDSDKSTLIDEILEKYYHTDRRFVTIIEYPSLKIYNANQI